jgi:hypothetical protein
LAEPSQLRGDSAGTSGSVAGPDDAIETTRAAARAHIRRGWAVFLLATDGPEGKIPLANCARCAPRTGTCREKETCECLTCHGFYAATHDPVTFDRALAAAPRGHLAVRTGRASRLLVLDAEAHADPDTDLTGLEALDRLEEFTGGLGAPDTLTAVTAHGGRHRYYHLPPDAPHVPSRNRVLPGVDVKCEGGLVVAVGSRSGRRVWQDPAVPVRTPSRGLLEWLAVARSGRGRGGYGGGGAAGGYDFNLFLRVGCPGGHRDSFFNELFFRRRKAGWDVERARLEALEHWKRCAQPPEARTRCEWWHIEYKLERVWHDVAPDEDVTRAAERLTRWLGAQERPGTTPDTLRVGRATVVRRGRRSV